MNNFKGGGFKKKKGGFGGGSKFKGGRGGDRRSGGGGDYGGNRSGKRQVEMFDARCSDCNKACSLPFRPNGDKPVFCSNCFEKKNNDSNRDYDRGAGRREGGRPDYTKLPRDQRPPRHNRPAAPQQNDAGLADVKKQLEKIEARLNRILDLINPPTPPTKKKNKAIEEKVEPTVVAKEKVVTTKVAKKTTTKKVAKKTATKKTASKVAKKTVIKKATKKVTKKVTKKATKKTVKKTTKKVAKKK